MGIASVLDNPADAVARALAFARDPDGLATVRQTGLLDAGLQDSLQRYTRLAAKLTGSPLSMVSVIDAERQYFSGAFSTELEQSDLDSSYCKHPAAALNAMSHNRGRACVGMFDLDGFKAYNDTFGHPAGDDLLVRIAERFRRVCRDNDAAAATPMVWPESRFRSGHGSSLPVTPTTRWSAIGPIGPRSVKPTPARSPPVIVWGFLGSRRP